MRDLIGYGYALANGTSMATPHLVGCAALIRSVAPYRSPAIVESTLKSTSVDLGSPGWDSSYGFGRVNCAAAVTVASSLPTPTPGPTSTTTPTPSATTTPLSTATGSATPTLVPVLGSSMSFNGTTAYLEAPHGAELNMADWTFEVWFRDENASYNRPRRRILTKGDVRAAEVPYFASIDSNVLYVGCSREGRRGR